VGEEIVTLPSDPSPVPPKESLMKDPSSVPFEFNLGTFPLSETPPVVATKSEASAVCPD
jgi:hypothetical protein